MSKAKRGSKASIPPLHYREVADCAFASQAESRRGIKWLSQVEQGTPDECEGVGEAVLPPSYRERGNGIGGSCGREISALPFATMRAFTGEAGVGSLSSCCEVPA